MNTQKTLGATMLAALAIAVIGAPGKLPPPHRFTGVFILWFVLGLAAQMGRDAARFASALSMLVVLAMAMGQAGKRMIGWLAGVGPRLAPAQPPAPAPATTTPAPRAGAGARTRPRPQR